MQNCRFLEQCVSTPIHKLNATSVPQRPKITAGNYVTLPRAQEIGVLRLQLRTAGSTTDVRAKLQQKTAI